MKEIKIPYFEAKELLDGNSAFVSFPIYNIFCDSVFSNKNNIRIEFNISDDTEIRYPAKKSYSNETDSIVFWNYMGDATHYSEKIYPPLEMKKDELIKIDCNVNTVLFKDLLVRVVKVNPVRNIQNYSWSWVIEFKKEKK